MLALSRQELPTLDRSRYAAADGSAPRRLRAVRSAGRQAATDSDRQRLRGRSDRRGCRAVATSRGLPCAACRCRVGSCSTHCRQASAMPYCRLPSPARLAVELGVAQGWERYIGPHGDMLCRLALRRFGAGRGAAARIRVYGRSRCARARRRCSSEVLLTAIVSADASTMYSSWERGAAGLAAGRMLAEAGRRVAILEARNRVGGRIFTHQVAAADDAAAHTRSSSGQNSSTAYRARPGRWRMRPV